MTTIDIEAARRAAREEAFKVRQEQEHAQQANGVDRSAGFTLLRDIKPNLDRSAVIRDLIPRGGLGVVYAPPGAGKTAIIVDMILHIAAGREYRGRRIEQQPVVYVALEGHGGINNRICAAADHLEVTDAPFALVRSSENFREPEAARKVAKIAGELMQAFGGDCPVIVIDTYTAALGAGGSDCDPKDVSAFLEHVKAHLTSQGFTALIVHHTGKDETRGARGWSGLLAALDFELEITRKDDDMRVLRVTKSRDGSDEQTALCFQLEGHHLGTDNFGEDVSAVVVRHLADGEAAPKVKRLNKTASAALGELWKAIKDPSRSFHMADQPGLRCVLADEWERACIAPGVISKCESERDRRKKFRAAKADLEAAEAIVCDGSGVGRVYPAPKAHQD